MTTKKTTKESSQALVIKEIALTNRQLSILSAPTPGEFVKVKPGRGGKPVKYVEGGFVVGKLNETFGPLNWDIEVLEEGQTERKNENKAEGEVWVRARLTIIDHVKGYKIGKTQYGQHPIHERVPIGDAKKAALTDALKKCASLLGVAADVYFKMPDEQTGGGDDKPKGKGGKKEATGNMSSADMYQRAKQMIADCDSIQTLREWADRLAESEHYGPGPKAQLKKMIDEKISKLEKNA